MNAFRSRLKVALEGGLVFVEDIVQVVQVEAVRVESRRPEDQNLGNSNTSLRMFKVFIRRSWLECGNKVERS